MLSHYALELLLEEVEAPLDVLEVLAAGEDDLSRGEEEGDDLGVLDPVHEPGELLGLVFDVLQVEGDDDLVEVDIFPDVVRTDDIGDGNFRLLVGVNAGSLEGFDDDIEAVRECLLVTDPCQYDFSRRKDQGSDLRVLDPVDRSREPFRIEFAALDLAGDLGKIYRIGYHAGSYDILNLQ